MGSKAICKKEPRGDHGLEGYVKGEQYRIEKVPGVRTYYRIWPVDGDAYYETATSAIFKRYFKEN